MGQDDGREGAAASDIGELDLRGLKCPLPVLRTRKALRGLPAGAGLVVTCTDPMSAIDIPNLVRQEGDCVEVVERDGDAIRFRIRRAAP
ncbi:sulfurtransferase TusA family protein [Methylobacterium nigriterrae]|uniref:sulfurtransferase TusA family protein n=1 Tax=Methylobacterium nigriterrae TaxID=3127512 RepID=UPI003013CC36